MTRVLFALILLAGVLSVHCEGSSEKEEKPVCQALGKFCYSKNKPCCEGLICHGFLSWSCKECTPEGEKCSGLTADQYEKPCCQYSLCQETGDKEYTCVSTKSKSRRSLADFFSY